MTWVEWAVVVLGVDLLWRVGRALTIAVRAVKASVDNWPRIPPERRRHDPVPGSVEVASDGIVSLDYSSGPKRH